MLTVMACKVKRPDGAIAESQMEELLYDYHLARSIGENLPVSDNYKKALYIQSVFQKYDVTQANILYSSVRYSILQMLLLVVVLLHCFCFTANIGMRVITTKIDE